MARVRPNDISVDGRSWYQILTGRHSEVGLNASDPQAAQAGRRTGPGGVGAGRLGKTAYIALLYPDKNPFVLKWSIDAYG